MRIRLSWNIKYSESGYLHIPLLYLTVGKDGFVFALPTFNVLVSWGEALKKQKLEESIKKKVKAGRENIKNLNTNAN